MSNDAVFLVQFYYFKMKKKLIFHTSFEAQKQAEIEADKDTPMLLRIAQTVELIKKVYGPQTTPMPRRLVFRKHYLINNND